jgi:pimeloyl-ACP methyl ester carboxylesterase
VVEDDDLLADVDPDIAEPFRGMAIVQSRPVLDRWEQDLTPAVALFDRELEPRLRARYTFSFDIDDLPQPFAGPSLIVAGRQDSECGYRDAWDIIENYPRGTYAVLDRSGHLVGVEQEAIVTALIGDWLDRVEEYAD